MKIAEVINTCSDLQVCQKREESEDYTELVFYANELNLWEQRMLECFGAPLKPPGAKPTKHDVRLAKEYGGIYPNQTLFAQERAEGILIAMFWPWQDKQHVTLKIAFLAK